MASAFIKKLATEFKSAAATGFTLDDIGIVVGVEVGNACGVGRGSDWGEGMCDEAFDALVEQVIAALPLVSSDPRSVAIHRRAARDCRAEDAHERRQLGFGA